MYLEECYENIICTWIVKILNNSQNSIRDCYNKYILYELIRDKLFK